MVASRKTSLFHATGETKAGWSRQVLQCHYSFSMFCTNGKRMFRFATTTGQGPTINRSTCSKGGKVASTRHCFHSSSLRPPPLPTPTSARLIDTSICTRIADVLYPTYPTCVQTLKESRTKRTNHNSISTMNIHRTAPGTDWCKKEESIGYGICN